jgi:hypothetical protein
MRMGVMHVRGMWVCVSHRLVFVKMRVGLARRICSTVRMTMVLIMHMRMRVGEATTMRRPGLYISRYTRGT